MGSWIMLYRSLLQSDVFKGPGLDLRIWLFLLLRVRYQLEPKKEVDGTIVRTGECYMALSRIADGVAWQEKRAEITPSRSSVWDALKRLKSKGCIELIPNSKNYMHIRIVNWDKYQGSIGRQSDTDEGFSRTGADHANHLGIGYMESIAEFQSDANRTDTRGSVGRQSDNVKEYKKERSKEEKNTEKGDVACASAREDTPPRVEEPKEATLPKASRTKAPTKQAMHAQAMAAYKAGAFPLPEHLDKPDVREALEEWLINRESMRCWLTENAIKRTVAKLGPFSPEEAVHLLNQSADNNWKGVVFPNTPPPGQVLTAKPVNGSVRVNGAKPRNERLYPLTTHEKNNPDWAKAYRKPQIVIKANGDREVRNG